MRRQIRIYIVLRAQKAISVVRLDPELTDTFLEEFYNGNTYGPYDVGRN